MSKNNYLNSKALTVGIITAVTILCAISGFAMWGATSMATAAYGAILGGVIGIVVGSTIDHYYGTEVSSIIAGLCTVIGGIFGAVYGKNPPDDSDENNLDPSFSKGASCFGKTIISNMSNLKDCLNGDVVSCFESTKGFSEIVTCMGEANNDLA